MPALHAYFPTDPDRDQEWAFESVRSTLAGADVTFDTKVNPFTRQANLKVAVDREYGQFHLTVSFEQGTAVDADLRTIADGLGAGFSRIRVLYGPDPDDDHTDVVVEVMDLFESFGPVLVYGADAERVFVDTLS
ncbi:hypothetical protein Cch01nite_32840 [Cellulomonas chitinilytica]|uniref:Uncharacterized protein n=1 Tax=Cellulomonas chitinilytica TaxID=398759 RepID=A0A919P5D8_9CELL|nr:hypothetical protein [Cellulomonas chitinilytica]GIG22560.1 hypothetical protein Cch01nite_32840 [Cellulomonas chitinilytica]